MSVSLSTLGVPGALVHTIAELPLSVLQIVLIAYLLYLILGCFIDGISIMVTTIPFMVPVMASLGVDLVWFGVVFIMIGEIGLITPPVGLNLFVVQGIAGPGTSLSDIFYGSLPFVLLTGAVVGLVTAFPEIVSFLPNLLGL